MQMPQANTPIQHVVVIYDENVSFDHYFATYPIAENPAGEPPFYASPGTPTVNGLTASLLTDNPNLSPPTRLDRSQALTADMDHGYTAEQTAFNGGLMDKFVQSTGHGNPLVMDYYDGNTVTALWNYAQHFALNDNFFGSAFGPSTPGALELIAGQTHGASAYSANVGENGQPLSPGQPGFPSWALDSNGTIYSDVDPYYDDASKGSTIKMTGDNIGDLLNARGLTWGWFQGGYDDPTRQHANIGGHLVTDYIPHHEPFQYYDQTSNAAHALPSSIAMIGHSDQANHQYGLTDFWLAADSGNLPNYSVLKAPGYEDGHPGYSDPIDEQRWIVQTINHLETLPSWSSTAVFITYDDSDGWYDHVMPPIISHSDDPAVDTLDGVGDAGTPAPGAFLDRTGYGPRLPLLVISPYAKRNAVINSIGDQSSITRFVEDNWNLGRLGNQSFDALAGSLMDMFDFAPGYHDSRIFLDPATGEPVAQNAPFANGGQLYMTPTDLAQGLDVTLHHDATGEWFLFNGHVVSLPNQGTMAQVDMQPFNLGGPVVTMPPASPPAPVAPVTPVAPVAPGAAAGAPAGSGLPMAPTVTATVYVPVDALADALGVTPIQYEPNEILFQSVN
ncbi:MAG: alkaline phosphatase family protein [Firmicutes bacterium]|nr:alkaline phosphatase family protein [Bacillota bacterium]